MCADDGKRALRALLDAEPADKRVQTKLTLLDELEDARVAGDATKEREIGGRLAALTRGIQTAGAEQRAAMIAAIERAQSVTDDDTRVAKLVDAFATCALTQITAHHDFGDEETVDRAIEMKHAIVAALDAIAPGRRVALARLLTSPFAGVRASAGAHLLNANLMRERVVPILQEIERTVPGSAGWTAFWALSPDDHGAWLTGGTEMAKN